MAWMCDNSGFSINLPQVCIPSTIKVIIIINPVAYVQRQEKIARLPPS